MTSLPETIVLHLGAHKTASTHLQKSIEAAAPLADVAFWGPQKLRQPGFEIAARFDLAKGATPEATRAMLWEMAGGKARLVLSDENFAGGLQTGWGRIPVPLYPRASDRLAALAATLARAGAVPVDVCLAIRDPVAYLTSAYSQILHGKRVVSPAKFRAKNPVAGIDWAGYVARLRAVPGVGRLVVWRHEDYGSLFHEICRAMIGDDAIRPLWERSQQRLSQTALEAVLAAKAKGLPNRVAEAARAHPVTAADPPFALFGEEDVARAEALYGEQWDSIRAMADVTPLGA